MEHRAAAQEIGEAFAVEYYKALKSEPANIHRYYHTVATVTRATEAPLGSFAQRREAAAASGVQALLASAHSNKTQSVERVICHSVETQLVPLLSDGFLLVQITGTVCFQDKSMRDFSQSVVLAPQVSQDGSKGYDVCNDILVWRLQQTQQQQQQLPPQAQQQRAQYSPAVVPPPVAASPTSNKDGLPNTTAPKLNKDVGDVRDVRDAAPPAIAKEPKVEVLKPEKKPVVAASATTPAAAPPAASEGPWRSTPKPSTNADPIGDEQRAAAAEKEASHHHHHSHPPKYAADSYAAKLLAAGGGGGSGGSGSGAPTATVSNASVAAPPPHSFEAKPAAAAAGAAGGRGGPPARAQANQQRKRLWVKVLPPHLTPEEIRDKVSALLVARGYTKNKVMRVDRHREFGYIEFYDEEAAELIKRTGLVIDDQNLYCDFATLAPRRTGGGGGGGRGNALHDTRSGAGRNRANNHHQQQEGGGWTTTTSASPRKPNAVVAN